MKSISNILSTNLDSSAQLKSKHLIPAAKIANCDILFDHKMDLKKIPKIRFVSTLNTVYNV